MARTNNNQVHNAADMQRAYAMYAKNIDLKFLGVDFENDVGKMCPVHGDNKSIKSKRNVVFHSTTMHTSDGKFKVWVVRSKSKYTQDIFEVKKPTKEEFLKVMLERATGKDAAGNKIIIKAEGEAEDAAAA
ncbi:hypothetical protein D6C77_08254 [Aureobasidium pullulans]|nr:hypothetical protein D6C77_08254 [Aureobasidium pullulans]